MIRPFVLLLALLIVQQINAAKKCYSGQNQRYAEKQCSSGGLDLDYACQTFTCEGGKSPFTLRTCARKNIGCIAGPRICQFSGGKGKCGRCDGDLSLFVLRFCTASDSDLACSKEIEFCNAVLGRGRCDTCFADNCNVPNGTDMIFDEIDSYKRLDQDQATPVVCVISGSRTSRKSFLAVIATLLLFLYSNKP